MAAAFVLERLQQSGTALLSDLISDFEQHRSEHPERRGNVSAMLTTLKRYGLVTNPERGTWRTTPELRRRAAQLGRDLTLEDVAKLVTR